MNQTSDSQKTPHTSPSRISYGVLCVARPQWVKSRASLVRNYFTYKFLKTNVKKLFLTWFKQEPYQLRTLITLWCTYKRKWYIENNYISNQKNDFITFTLLLDQPPLPSVQPLPPLCPSADTRWSSVRPWSPTGRLSNTLISSGFNRSSPSSGILSSFARECSTSPCTVTELRRACNFSMSPDLHAV